MFDDVQRLVERPELVDEFCPNLQVLQEINASLDLSLQIRYPPAGEDRPGAVPAVNQLRQLDIDIDQRALRVFPVVILQCIIQMTGHANVVHDVATFFTARGPVHSSNSL